MMNYVSEDVLSLERITITNLLQEIGGSKVRQELLTGLQRKHKYNSSKFFYKQRSFKL